MSWCRRFIYTTVCCGMGNDCFRHGCLMMAKNKCRARGFLVKFFEFCFRLDGSCMITVLKQQLQSTRTDRMMAVTEWCFLGGDIMSCPHKVPQHYRTSCGSGSPWSWPPRRNLITFKSRIQVMIRASMDSSFVGLSKDNHFITNGDTSIFWLLSFLAIFCPLRLNTVQKCYALAS
jgi:hypothetical protein